MEGKLASKYSLDTVQGLTTCTGEIAYRYGSAIAKLVLVAGVLCAIARANSQQVPVVYTVDASQSTAAIQEVLDGASTGDVVNFAAGQYNITTPMYPPCGATLTGPVASPATAVLSATFTYNNIFFLSGCVIPTTIEYLGFANTGGIYVTAPSAGLTVTKNQFTSLPANISQTTDMGVYFDGTKGGTTSRVVITDNTFGDPSSCSAVMSFNQDMGGLCIGVLFQGNVDGVLIENNVFTHLEEGFHVICYGNLCTGSSSPTLNNFVAQWNDFNNIHRIAVEIQPQNATNVVIQYNSYENAFLPSTFSMGISAACCGGVSGATTPLINNNLLLANSEAAGEYIAYALEWWGNGAQADNNLIQGNWANGIVWGKGGGPWEIKNTVVEGPYMGGNYGCFICDEREGAITTPVQTGNSTSFVVTPVTSVKPVILVKAGKYPGAAIVTLKDSGTNHSIYYTTDGSTPTTASTRYVAPFSVSVGTTLNAIGMWGQGANPLNYPPGYGYIPSEIVTRQIVELPPVLVGAYLAAKGNVGSIQRGRTLQIIAHGIYSDGSSGLLPDGQGNVATAWNTSSHAVAKISSAGHVTAMRAGKVTVEGRIGDLVAAPMLVTVTEAAGSVSKRQNDSTGSGEGEP